MEKSRLQELCQRKKWPLPSYETKQEGLPHQPRFTTTVIVDFTLIISNKVCTTNLSSQQHAAQHAYDHFFKKESASSSLSEGMYFQFSTISSMFILFFKFQYRDYKVTKS
jgi:dsRNA-specific ribonuclease